MKVLCLSMFIVLASGVSAAAQEIVTTKVIDETGAAIPFATLKISSKSNKNTPVVRVTDNNGISKIQHTNETDLFITVTEIGHVTLSQAFYNVNRKASDTLILSLKKSTQELAGVTIQGRKKLITQKIDRLVMNIGGNALTAGKSSLEIFSMAPGVMVSNGSISINGNAGTRIMVNGKILQLSGDALTSYLDNLWADDIESIEVIAHPPAEYEAQGTGGMLNIILKKQRSSGLNGSVSAGYTQGRYAGTNEGLRLNFKDKKVSVFANYSFNKLKSYEDSYMKRNYLDQSYKFSENSNRIINDQGNRVNTGIVYDISNEQYIALDYSGSFNKKGSTYSSTAHLVEVDPAKEIINTGTFPKNTKTNYNNIGINYNLLLDKLGSTFQVLADYTSNKMNTISEANSAFYNADRQFLSDTTFRNTTPSDAAIYTADIRYTKNLKNKNSISFGAKGASTRINNSAQFEHFEDGIWKPNEAQDYIYDYKEKILAGYFNFSGTLLKTEVKLGLRGEYTDMEGNLLSAATLTKRDYLSLFPSLFLKKNTNSTGDNYVSVYYGRRLLRPSYNNLNPYESYINSYSVTRGNPYLNPSFSNTYEVGFTLKNKYTFKVAYQKDKDLVSQFIKVDDQNPLLWIYTYQNYGKNTNLSFSVNLPVTITKWWESNTNIDIRHQEVITPDLKIAKGAVFFQTNHDFKLSPKTSINLSGYYVSNLISGNFYVSNLYTMNIGAQHKFLANKLLLRTTVTDPFNSYKLNGRTVYKDYTSSAVQRRQSRTLNLSLIYNFDLGKTFKSKKLEKSSKEEEGRL